MYFCITILFMWKSWPGSERGNPNKILFDCVTFLGLGNRTILKIVFIDGTNGTFKRSDFIYLPRNELTITVH